MVARHAHLVAGVGRREGRQGGAEKEEIEREGAGVGRGEVDGISEDGAPGRTGTRPMNSGSMPASTKCRVANRAPPAVEPAVPPAVPPAAKLPAGSRAAATAARSSAATAARSALKAPLKMNSTCFVRTTPGTNPPAPPSLRLQAAAAPPRPVAPGPRHALALPLGLLRGGWALASASLRATCPRPRKGQGNARTLGFASVQATAESVHSDYCLLWKKSNFLSFAHPLARRPTQLSLNSALLELD
jgi:hypothetical protein